MVFEDSGDSRGVAEVLLELGRVAHTQGNEARALALVRESLVRSQKLDNKTQIAFCLTLAGGIQAAAGPARATRLFGAGKILLQSLEAALGPSGSLEYDKNLADTRARLGEEAFAKVWQEGRTMPLEQAVTEAMSNSS